MAFVSALIGAAWLGHEGGVAHASLPPAVIAEPEVVPGKGLPGLRVLVRTRAQGLAAGDFRLKVDGKYVDMRPAWVRPFSRSDAELSVLILVEGTPRFLGAPAGEDGEATPGYYDEVRSAIEVLSSFRSEHTRMALAVYDRGLSMRVAMGPPERVTGDSLGPLASYAARPASSLAAALRGARDVLGQEQGRRVVFLFTDGRDSGESRLRDEVRALAEASIETYVVGGSPHGVEPKDRNRLQQLARRGKVMLAGLADQVPALTRVLVGELDSVYEMEFPGRERDLTLPFDGRSHELSVLARTDESDARSITLPKLTSRVIAPPVGSSRWAWFAAVATGVMAILMLVAVRARRRAAAFALAGLDLAPPEPSAAVPLAAPAAPRRTLVLGAVVDPFPVVAWIVPLTGVHRLRTFRLGPGITAIGTAPTAQVCVPDAYMSPVHAEIRCVAQEFVLVDRGSPNGTFVGAQRVPAHALADNDTFTCGATSFRFKTI